MGPDPRVILDGWLSGRYVRDDGQVVIGRVWDDDTRYRYGLLLAGIDAPDGWTYSWFDYIGPLVWTFEPVHLADWAGRVPNLDRSPMSEAGRARAVSAVRSFYAHCVDDLGARSWKAASWDIPSRRRLVGTVAASGRDPLTPAQTEALRQAAAEYSGRAPELARLVAYLCLAQVRPGQACGLDLAHVSLDDQDGPTWRLPGKNNAASAVIGRSHIPRPLIVPLAQYLAVRTHRAPWSTATTGPLLTSAGGTRGGAGGQALRSVTLTRILRAVAASHPDLEPIAGRITPDLVAHSPSPFGEVATARTWSQAEAEAKAKAAKAAKAAVSSRRPGRVGSGP